MKPNSFNTLAERLNREHLRDLFGIPLNQGSEGIDLIDHKKKIGIELKGAIARNGLSSHDFSFKIGVHQIYEYKKNLSGYTLYWAFVPFELEKPISEITPNSIEQAIGRREILLFDWNYIHTFTVFDDEIHECYGSNGFITPHIIFGLENPYNKISQKSENAQKANFAATQESLFENLETKKTCKKKILEIARKDLYIRPYGRTIIKTGQSSTIFCNIHDCKDLIDAYQHPHMQMSRERQQEMKFASF